MYVSLLCRLLTLLWLNEVVVGVYCSAVLERLPVADSGGLCGTSWCPFSKPFWKGTLRYCSRRGQKVMGS